MLFKNNNHQAQLAVCEYNHQKQLGANTPKFLKGEFLHTVVYLRRHQKQETILICLPLQGSASDCLASSSLKLIKIIQFYMFFSSS